MRVITVLARAARNRDMFVMAGSRAALAALALAVALGAQAIPTVGDTTAPPVKEPGHAFIQGPHETVNPANGQVSLRFDVPLPPGHGPTPSFSIAYDSAGANFLSPDQAGNIYVASQLATLSSNGWSYTVPMLSYNIITAQADDLTLCDISTDYVMQGEGGGRHSFALSTTGFDASRQTPDVACGYSQYGSVSTGDGWLATTATLNDAFWKPLAVSVASPGGTTYEFPGSSSYGFGIPASTVTDRNGNVTSYSVSSSNGAITITDDLGRQALVTTGFNQGTDTLTASGMSNSYSATWGAGYAGAGVTVTGAGPSPCAATSATPIAGGNVITSLVTPEGTYTFSYDPTYGLLDRITYPGGGYVRYVWGFTPGNSEAGQFYVKEPSTYLGLPPTCYGVYPTAVVTDRYVSPDGSTETEHQQFTYSTTWDPSNTSQWDYKTTTVTTTDTATGANYQTIYTYTPLDAPRPNNNDTMILTEQVPMESSVVVKNSAGTKLRTVAEDWGGNYPYQLDHRYTTLDNSQEDEMYAKYDTNGQITERDDYDFGPGAPGPLLRATTIAYASGFTGGLHLVNRPYTIITCKTGTAPPCTSANAAAESTYTYNVANGNLEQSQRWVSGTASPLATSYSYTSTGEVSTITDPAGGVTTLGYAANWFGPGPSGNSAYVTSVTDPLGHVTTYAWNYASGTMYSRTGPNSNATTFSYDGWSRLDAIGYPDGGETGFGYSPTTFETDHKQDTNNDWEETLETFDGIGRPIVNATETASGSWSRTDTCYNGWGEPDFVSYPYASSSNAGPANCNQPGESLEYDALGRQTLATYADGANNDTVTTSYSGRAAETQDEGNGTSRVTRITQHDALGRLTDVCEVTAGAPPTEGPAPTACNFDISAASGFLTSYAYDPLGNLTSVTQGGETRSFTYL